MTRKAAMTQPTENGPTNEPSWHGQSQLSFWTERASVIRTSLVRAMHQLANQDLWPIEHEDTMAAITANVHSASTLAAPWIFDIQKHLRPIHVLWQSTSHSQYLLATRSGGDSLPLILSSTNRRF